MRALFLSIFICLPLAPVNAGLVFVSTEPEVIKTTDGAIEFKSDLENTYPSLISPILEREMGAGFILGHEYVPKLSSRTISVLSKFNIIVVTTENGYWSMYGVKYNNSYENFSVGSIVNLDTLLSKGHIIYRVFVPNEEMYQLIRSFD